MVSCCSDDERIASEGVAKLLSMGGIGGRDRVRCRRLSARRFWRRFGRLEHERLEFKSAADRVTESVVAMAMTEGGTILVGVSDERRVIGCRVDQVMLDRLANVAHETQVDLRIDRLSVGGRTVLAIAVPPVAPRVVTTPDGRLLHRVGGSNRPLRGDGVVRFLRAHQSMATPGVAGSSSG